MQINSPEDVEDRIRDYIQRWKIERFHYVLKSGCKICEKQERSYKKLTEIVLLYSVIAMPLMNILYFGRLYPETPSSVFLEEMEWKLFTVWETKRGIRQNKCIQSRKQSII